jgi:anti-sigma regulatory factor (Ser/Thr protein kinase)
MAHTMKLHFDTEPIIMRAVRKQAATAATVFGATEYQAGRIELAVGEALSNAQDHGYDGKVGPIELEIAYALHQFAVTIHDRGKEFSIAQWPEPPDPRTGNGYGLHIIKQLMDEADFQDAGPSGGTTLRMAIRLGEYG